MSGGDRTGRYLKHAQTRPQYHKSGHVPVAKKQYPSASYPAGHGVTDRYTPTPKPGSGPTTNRTGLLLESQDCNWTLQESNRNALNDPKVRRDNGSQSPDSVFTVSSGSNLSYHGGFQGGESFGRGGGGGSILASKSKYSQSMLDIRDLFFDASGQAGSPVPAHHQRSNSLRRSHGSGGAYRGEFVKVKVEDFKDDDGTGSLARNKYKSESNLFELEVEEIPQRWNERRPTVPLNAPLSLPSHVPIRSVTLRKSKGMFGFILNCKPLYNDPYVPDSLRYYPHVESIVENSIAKAFGLQCGDFVLEIGGLSVERGTFDLCNFLIRSSGDCLKLKIASYGQFRTTAVSRTVETAHVASGPLGNALTPRTPAGHVTSMERRCNDAKTRHVTKPTQLQRATSTPNLPEDPLSNIYDELRFVVPDEGTPHRPPFPSQGKPEVGRSTGDATQSRNDAAKHAGNPVAYRKTPLNSTGPSPDARTHPKFPVFSPPGPQTDVRPEGAGVKDIRARTGITDERPGYEARLHGGMKQSGGKGSPVDPTIHTIVPKASSNSGSLERREEELVDPVRNLRHWNHTNKPMVKTTDGRNDKAIISPPEVVKSADIVRIDVASGVASVPVQSHTVTEGRTGFHGTPRIDAGGPPGIKNTTPKDTPSAVVTPNSVPVGSAGFAAKLPSVVEPATSATKPVIPPSKTSFLPPQSQPTNQAPDVTSSDENDENPSFLLAAIRSHPLLRNRRPDAERGDSSRIPQVAPLRGRAPAPLPKRMPGPPGRSVSTDEVKGQSLGGGQQVRRSSETPSAEILPQSAIKSLRQVKAGNQTTGSGSSGGKIWNKNEINSNENAPKKSNISTNQTRDDQSSSTHKITKPTNQQQLHQTPMRENTKNTPLRGFLELRDATTEQSYSEERGEEREETKRGQSSFENARLTFDRVTGKLLLADVTVDETEIDPVPLPPPPSEFTSGAVDPVGRSARHVTKAQSSFDGFHGNDQLPTFSSKKSAGGDSAFADVTSFPPPVHFDDIPEETNKLQNGFRSKDFSDSRVRNPNVGLDSPEATTKRIQPLPAILPLPPPEFQLSSEFRTHPQPTGPVFDSRNLKPVSDLTNQISNPLFSESSPTAEASSPASRPPGSRREPPSNGPGPNKPVGAWSSSDVGDWLRSIGLGRYSEVFVSRSVDGQTLCRLTRKDLIDLGVKEMEHRRDIERAVLRMKMPQVT